MVYVDTPPGLCPECGRLLRHASDMNGTGHRPKPGDLSLCFNCGAINEFDVGLGLRPPSQETLDKLPPDAAAKLFDAQRSIRTKAEKQRLYGVN